MAKIEGIQAEHLPRFLAMERQALATKANTDEILAFLTHAKSWSGYVRKYGKPVAVFLLGVAVTKGYITAENGKNFLSIFGL